MTIFFYEGLTSNPEIGNTPVWVLPNIWRLEQVRDTESSTNVSKEMLLNAAKCQAYSFYHFWVIKEKPTEGCKFPLFPPPTTRLELSRLILAQVFFRFCVRLLAFSTKYCKYFNPSNLCAKYFMSSRKFNPCKNLWRMKLD